MAYHPQTDGQTERMNQEIEKYLCMFINEKQTDWADWLRPAEFALNNQANWATGYSPFFLNHGCNPYDGFTPKKIRVKVESAEEFAKSMNDTIQKAKIALEKSSEQMERYWNSCKRPSRGYEVGDKVMLDARNIRTTRPSQKLNNKWFGPYEVLEKVGTSAYKLDIPQNWSGIHNVFNEALLKPFYTPTSELHQKRNPRPAPELVGSSLEYELEKIIDCRKHGNQWQYKVKWVGYPDSKSTWQPVRDLIPNALESIMEFHTANPKMPRPPAVQKLEFMPEGHQVRFFNKDGTEAPTPPIPRIVEKLTEPPLATMPTERQLLRAHLGFKIEQMQVHQLQKMHEQYDRTNHRTPIEKGA